MRLLPTILITFVLAITLFAQSTPQVKSVTWEYKFEFSINEKKANQLGNEGWEAISCQLPTNAGFGSNTFNCVFKRAK